MKKKSFTVYLEIYEQLTQLPEETQELMNVAREACEEAYAPYSLFKVGAAIRLATGEIVRGNNQENAAFPSGLCAERVASFQAAARFPGVAISQIAVTVHSEKKEISTPTPPCGACRQVLAEFEYRQNQPISVYFSGSRGPVVKASSVSDLLPMLFDSSFLM